MKEIWKNIKGYEGLYQVSNLGRVKSLERKDNLGRKVNEKILKNRNATHGYIAVILSKDSNKKTYRVHRLVAEAFIPNPNKYLEVNHKDENKSNNRIDNLEWCDRKYNCNYGTFKERHSKR